MRKLLLSLSFLMLRLSLSTAEVQAATPQTLPVAQAAHFCRLLVSDGEGNVYPLGMYAQHLVTLLCGQPSYNGLTAEQVFTGLVFFFDEWAADSLVIMADGERRQLLGELHSGMTLRVFPSRAVHSSVQWYAPTGELPADIDGEHRRYMTEVFPRLAVEARAGNWPTVDEYITRMMAYQCRYGGSEASRPSDSLYSMIAAVSLFLALVVLGCAISFRIFAKKMRMRNRHWTLKEGFLIGGGVVVAGLILELCVGPVAWDAFRWPVNGMVLAAFLLTIVAIHLLKARFYACRFIGTLQAAVPALAYVVVLTVVMGLTRQTSDGTWFSNMLAFWPFVLAYAYMAVVLGLAVCRRLTHLSSWRRDVSFLLNHAGLFVAMVTATLGHADMQRLKMIAVKGEPEWRAMDQQSNIHELPMSIELKQFVMETYEADSSARAQASGGLSPRRFASDVRITTSTGRTMTATVDVNKPVMVDGWKIYQYGYDTQMGAMSRISVLELVRDPWLPAVYAGICMMLAGTLCMFVFGGRRKRL